MKFILLILLLFYTATVMAAPGAVSPFHAPRLLIPRTNIPILDLAQPLLQARRRQQPIALCRVPLRCKSRTTSPSRFYVS
jgi:hypothetical protein